MIQLITTRFVHPPIPDRSHDWLAFLADREEETRFYGYGRTEEEARQECVAAIEEWEAEQAESKNNSDKPLDNQPAEE
jgi:hypothetical protein